MRSPVSNSSLEGANDLTPDQRWGIGCVLRADAEPPCSQVQLRVNATARAADRRRLDIFQDPDTSPSVCPPQCPARPSLK